VPHKKSNKPHEPERDYSHRLLLDKLGVKPGQRIGVLGVEDAVFLNDLAGPRSGIRARQTAQQRGHDPARR
jgi:hypothetical protein